MLGLIGRKIGMTTIFEEDGRVVPVTVIKAGPCLVTRVKNGTSDGYNALQLGYEDVKEKHLKKPQIGAFKKSNITPKRYLREFRLNDSSKYEVGQEIKADIFSKDDYLDVSGISKGKGFQGVIKRHNFSGGPQTHGSHFHRTPGSIGQCASPGKVWKNVKLPGQMGNKNITVQNLKVVEVRLDDNLIMIKGAIPGGKNTLVKMTMSIKKTNKSEKA